MSEAELLAEIQFLLERSNYLTQWWASMSLGLILLAHFGRKSLNLPIVIVILLVYVSFSINMWGQFQQALAPYDAFRSDLETLQAAGNTTNGTDAILSDRGVRPWHIFTYPVSMFGLFLGSIFYLLYSYRQTRNRVTNRHEGPV